MGRENQLSDAFVGLADTLGDDFDMVDLFERLAGHCVALTGADAAGIMMSDGRGRLRVIAASDQGAAFLELFQLPAGMGPCLDTYTGGQSVIAAPIEACAERWPELVPAVLAAGFRAVATVPLRLHDQVIGGVNLFYASPDPSTEEDLHLAQALSDVAAFAMLRWPPQRASAEEVLGRIQATITNKVAVEQAKGALAQFGGLSIADAGDALRTYAHTRRLRVTDVARAIVRRTLAPGAVLEPAVLEPLDEGVPGR